jgi:hypothetical protein
MAETTKLKPITWRNSNDTHRHHNNVLNKKIGTLRCRYCWHWQGAGLSFHSMRKVSPSFLHRTSKELAINSAAIAHRGPPRSNHTNRQSQKRRVRNLSLQLTAPPHPPPRRLHHHKRSSTPGMTHAATPITKATSPPCRGTHQRNTATIRQTRRPDRHHRLATGTSEEHRSAGKDPL